ncbi:O-fucosyltransferase family protein [Abeliophyllum distichum]|uniref:O-fucosyltransferase family protein n=1 Tax=Abeliophyllum distichum TaxID=126358 RepID=A0ABD1R8N3_9LAMI
MSNGGTTNSGTSGSPIIGGPYSTHRRRVADLNNDVEKSLDHVQISCDHSIEDNDSETSNDDNVGGCQSHHHHHHHPMIRHLFVRKRVPENWVLGVEESILSAYSILHSLRSRNNMGRIILGLLLVLVMLSAYLKFSFMTGVGQREVNEILIVQNFNSDWSNAQRVMFESDASSGDVMQKRQMKEFPVPEIWMKPNSDDYYQCIARPRNRIRTGSATNGYIIVHANGGLNQMRTGICDMAAIAKIMNATLVLPSLDHESFWTDPSDFKDIFDWRHFIEVLKDDIEIVESLPSQYAALNPVVKAPVSWSKASYYREKSFLC